MDNKIVGEGNNPLVSLIVVSYQQERYIREAVRSAFAQTYQPLQVILSDDSSTDATFRIMEEEVRSYKGPHQVVLRKTEKNSGLAQNLNEAWGLAQGGFVVVQAGDDISLPHRVEVLASAWRYPTRVDCVFSNYSLINSDGEVLSVEHFGKEAPRYSSDINSFMKSNFCWVSGCSAAYSTGLNTSDNKISPTVLSEDAVLAFRAILGSGIRYVSEPLVLYRKHDSNIFTGKGLEHGKASRKDTVRWNLNRVSVAEEWYRSWAKSGLQIRGLAEILLDLKRSRNYEYMASKAPRLFLPILALKGMRDGMPLIQVARLMKRYLFKK